MQGLKKYLMFILTSSIFGITFKSNSYTDVSKSWFSGLSLEMDMGKVLGHEHKGSFSWIGLDIKKAGKWLQEIIQNDHIWKAP